MEQSYKILIVDENLDQIEDFNTFFDNILRIQNAFQNISFELFSINALTSEDELFSFIIDNEIDCVAFDYKLMENNSSFSQQGDIYQYHLLEHFDNFPTIILTNNADEAKRMKADPFKIISKRVINFDLDDANQTEEAKTLVEKIIYLIDKYKEEIDTAESRLLDLIEKERNGEVLSEPEINEMVELDSKLENSISKKSKIPKDWKSPAGIDAIKNMVANSESILAQLKKLNHE